jgi:hypothetical protein
MIFSDTSDNEFEEEVVSTVTTKKEEEYDLQYKFAELFLTSTTDMDGMLVACRAPKDDELGDYFWIAKRLPTFNAGSRKSKQIQVQWFERDPSQKGLVYYITEAKDCIL